MNRLALLAGVMLIVGLVWSLRQPVPGLYPDTIVPVKDGELEWLNSR